jgi:hypothetical protein
MGTRRAARVPAERQVVATADRGSRAIDNRAIAEPSNLSNRTGAPRGVMG